jgi:midasin
MNPGGDFGKKELSPALRNRFTEIWVENALSQEDIRRIVSGRISQSGHENTVATGEIDKSSPGAMIALFCTWYNAQRASSLRPLTIRDCVSWAQFIQSTANLNPASVTTHRTSTDSVPLHPHVAFIHGACLTLLDGLAAGTVSSASSARSLKDLCAKKLLAMVGAEFAAEGRGALSPELLVEIWERGRRQQDEQPDEQQQPPSSFGIPPFFIPLGPVSDTSTSFSFRAPTTACNAFRLLRAMQLRKPVLLEGSPGVGKTSLVAALAKATGHSLVRINFSDQTDIMDLFGTDLPCVSADGEPMFKWSDGILLRALKSGAWVLLDELNLAPQPVLEGLNALLDHREQVYIPELNQTFDCPSSFRVFAAQNPFHQGGGRKGLPKSFMNRFTAVTVAELLETDLQLILSNIYPQIQGDDVNMMVHYVQALNMLANSTPFEGYPWEINLRDAFRWSDAISANPHLPPSAFVDSVFLQRFRNSSNRDAAARLWSDISGVAAEDFIDASPSVGVERDCVRIGHFTMQRRGTCSTSKHSLNILPSLLRPLQAAALAVSLGWVVIVTGSEQVAKSSMVRMMAQMHGAVLHEIGMSPDTDNSDIIGCFEQAELQRSVRTTLARVQSCVDTACSGVISALSSFDSSCWSDWLAACASASSEIFNISSTVFSGSKSLALTPQQMLAAGVIGRCSALVDQVRLNLKRARFSFLDFAFIFARFDAFIQCRRLLSEVDPAAASAANHAHSFVFDAALDGVNGLNFQLQKSDAAGRFEWSDGFLVDALQVLTAFRLIIFTIGMPRCSSLEPFCSQYARPQMLTESFSTDTGFCLTM